MGNSYMYNSLGSQTTAGRGGLWNSAYGGSFNGVGSFLIKAGYCIIHVLLQLGVAFIGN